jgi:uncharacterized protein with PIN domain
VTNEYVPDASTIIALLKFEPGADFVADRLSARQKPAAKDCPLVIALASRLQMQQAERP